MVRYFFLSLNVLNCLLGLAVAAVLNFAVLPLLNPVARISLPALKEAATPSGEPRSPSRPFSVSDYAVISDKNLFHPDRRIPVEKQQEKAVPKPDVLLYGTLIADDASLAFIEDKKAPYSTPGRGKRQTTLKKGDHVSGYIVSEIAADRIVLVKGEEKVVVMLDDRKKTRSSEAPAVSAAGRTAEADMPPSPAIKASPYPASTASSPAVASPGAVIPRTAPQPSPQSPLSSPPQTSPSTPAVASPGVVIPRTAPRLSPQPSLPSSPQAPPSTLDEPSRPGIGGSGVWPPTRESAEQTRQKLKDAQQMRMEQLKRGQ